MKFISRIFFGFLVVVSVQIHAATHPGLFLTPSGVREIRSSLGKLPLFDQSYQELKSMADQALLAEIIVPVPKDGGGGYTHEKHKNNYYEMNAAGIVFQITKDPKYAQFVKNMLFKYAEMYPGLGLHPAVRSKTPGKIFWQALNEAVWLVHTSMAYDCVYDFMSKSDRDYVEKNLFYPMCEFISNGNQPNIEVFNMMHNHGTWATAAVGMIGYVMGDEELVAKALYGSAKDGNSGFIRQLDVLFSPDGYFTEGPYYQRYAIWPFMMFAQVIENKQPGLKIFERRDGILHKAVDKLIQSSYQGELFYLNDALKKTFQTQEMVYAVNIAYKNNPLKKDLLDIARQQGYFVVSDAGIATAKALAKGKIVPFEYRSMFMSDGREGDEGGIAVFRTKQPGETTTMTFKATSHGLSHGHYDKLSITLNDNGNPILADYGAVRFLNIEPKSGGNYTKENYSWGMQTIAHNTVTINETSHFDAKIQESSKFHSEVIYTDFSNPDVQVISAKELNAYPGVEMQRTTSLVSHPAFQYPLMIDFFHVKSDNICQTVDLPFHYRGHLVSTSFGYQKEISVLKTLGDKNGYQHLWLEAKGKTDQSNAKFSWVNGNRFYSVTTLADTASSFLFTRTGAMDPIFNLRQEPAFIVRQNNVSKYTFASVIEPHGLYDISKEVTVGYRSNVESLKLLADNAQMSVVEIKTTGNKILLYGIAREKSGNLQYEYRGSKHAFSGKYLLVEIINQ